jgi:hypothetical protein
MNPKQDLQYLCGKIYKIYCPTGDKCDVYYGSTKRPIIERYKNHIHGYITLDKNKNFTSSSLIFDKYGIENCIVEICEYYPCTNIHQLTSRENQYITKNKCSNTNLPKFIPHKIDLTSIVTHPEYEIMIQLQQKYKKSDDYFIENQSTIISSYVQTQLKRYKPTLEDKQAEIQQNHSKDIEFYESILRNLSGTAILEQIKPEMESYKQIVDKRLQNETEICIQDYNKQIENHNSFIKRKQREQDKKERNRMMRTQQLTPEQKQLQLENQLKREALEKQKLKEQLVEKERIRQEQILKQIEEKRRIERKKRIAERNPDDIATSIEVIKNAPNSLAECNDEQKQHFNNYLQFLMDSIVSDNDSNDEFGSEHDEIIES